MTTAGRSDARQYNITLQPGQEVPIDINNASFVRMTENSSPSDKIKIRIGDGAFQDMTSGQAIKRAAHEEAFNQLTLLNPNGSAQTVEVRAGSGAFDDQRFQVSGSVTVVNANGDLIETEEATPDTLTTAADQAITTATKTSVVAANANRVEVIVQNLDALGGASMRVGDTNTGAARGMLVSPQGTAILQTTAEVFVYHAKGSNLSVAVTEIERS